MLSRGSPRVRLPAGTEGLAGDVASGLTPGVNADDVGRLSIAALETPLNSDRVAVGLFATEAVGVEGRFGRRTTSSLPPGSRRSPGVFRGLRGFTICSRTRTGRSSVWVYCFTRSSPMPRLTGVWFLPET